MAGMEEGVGREIVREAVITIITLSLFRDYSNINARLGISNANENARSYILYPVGCIFINYYSVRIRGTRVVANKKNLS